MSRDAVLCLKQLHLTVFYKISESSYVCPINTRAKLKPGDLVTLFGGLGRKILTPYPTTARGLRCCFLNSLQHFHRQNSTDHSVSTTFAVTE